MELTFFGQSGWGLEAGRERILVDPYPVSDASGALLRDYADDRLSHVLVTHAGFDHLGIALELVRRTDDVRLVADVAVTRHAAQAGVPAERIDVIGWNLERVAGAWHFRALEAKHASIIETADGEHVTGMPLGFLLWHESEPEVRVFHLGDTSIFSDLGLFGQIYRPTVAIVNVCGAMNAREAAQATLWMGVDIALPAHFMHDPAAAEDFCAAVAHLPREVESWVPEVGWTYAIQRETSIARRRVDGSGSAAYDG